ncbi:sodium:solute symporter family protein [Flavihumibacter petaseus]|uniref:Putative SSS family transporter n=1 Tax=Flavihumibacter petaseus NBRC 106054 TaxID=1220578 RepID=A0A0E9N0S9_9BACT|nr:sodium:solute symporter family protein [Flavihumibacter petaseus]GAO43256.1 putative SSS family transporter [Flavihumibacter petaseus NBRC 106054]
MKLQWIDWSIIAAYLLLMVLLGFWFRKKARQNQQSYLLGGKSLPWYMLGLSDASDMFDISGTMWMVALCFVYGMKSIWIPWLWPVFNQVFMMMFLSKWLRRSNADTGAAWLTTRFGHAGKGVRGSHNVVVAFALLSCFGFLAYGFIGLGKFIEIFVPWHLVQQYIPFSVSPQYVPHFYGIIFTLFAMFYSILGGMHSIVLGDFIKYLIMTVACIAVAIIAIKHLHRPGIQLHTPKGWTNPFFGWKLDLDWNAIAPAANDKIRGDGYGLFGIFFMMMLFKGYFASLAGPAPNYDMQKVLSTRSPKDASKMSGFVSIILLPVRYSLIIGLTVLALLYYNQLPLQGADGITDFERILPAAINSFLPTGILGLVLTGLLGAFMGTFSGTLNAAQAYIVNDIYLKYINPGAPTRTIIRTNYIVGVIVVSIGVILGFFAKDVNTVLQIIVGALYGGYIAANVLKWYWWRFNAHGFFWGMLSGILAGLVCSMVYTGLSLYYFPALLVISLAGAVAGTYTAPPTEEAVLINFYKTVRPWGWWEPVRKKVLAEDPAFPVNRNFRLDMFNVVLGIIAQCCLTILPMYLVLWLKTPLMITIGILAVIIFILKKTWWNKLEN